MNPPQAAQEMSIEIHEAGENLYCPYLYINPLGAKISWSHGYHTAEQDKKFRDEAIAKANQIVCALTSYNDLAKKANALLGSIDTIIEETVSNQLFGHKEDNRHTYAAAIYAAADRIEQQRGELRVALAVTLPDRCKTSVPLSDYQAIDYAGAMGFPPVSKDGITIKPADRSGLACFTLPKLPVENFHRDSRSPLLSQYYGNECWFDFDKSADAASIVALDLLAKSSIDGELDFLLGTFQVLAKHQLDDGQVAIAADVLKSLAAEKTRVTVREAIIAWAEKPELAIFAGALAKACP